MSSSWAGEMQREEVLAQGTGKNKWQPLIIVLTGNRAPTNNGYLKRMT